jgi:hypothetical protein
MLQLPSAISHLGVEKTLLLHFLFFMDFSGLVQLVLVSVFLEVLLISVRHLPVRFFRFGATQHQIMVVSNGKTVNILGQGRQRNLKISMQMGCTSLSLSWLHEWSCARLLGLKAGSVS